MDWKHLRKKDAIIAYKGFDEDLCCRGFQYKVGKTYHTRKEVSVCDWGFHACQDPIDVLRYYSPSQGRRFCKVKMWGWVDMIDDKLASSYIEIVEEISLEDLELKTRYFRRENAATERCCRSSDSSISSKQRNAYVTNGGTASVAVAHEDKSLAETLCENSNALAMGGQSNAVTFGRYSLAGALNTFSSAVTKDTDSCAVSMHSRSFAICHNSWSMAVCNEYLSTAICVGKESYAIAKNSESSAEAKGKASCAIALGKNGMTRGALGCALVLMERGEWDYNIEAYPITNIKAVIVDGEKVKADTWYTLKNGELVEVKQDKC